MPDYLAIGSDDDFVRMPMTPQTAQRIADRFGCVLPTRKMVDAIDAVAEVRLAPQPMTEDREAVAAFCCRTTRSKSSAADKPLGLLTIGTKKDIVLTPRIFERPQRLAIYGWRQLDGQPIQPLTIVHLDWYVDYSHGVRLVRDRSTSMASQHKIAELLRDRRCGLVSDEGPMQPPRYPCLRQSIELFYSGSTHARIVRLAALLWLLLLSNSFDPFLQLLVESARARTCSVPPSARPPCRRSRGREPSRYEFP